MAAGESVGHKAMREVGITRQYCPLHLMLHVLLNTVTADTDSASLSTRLWLTTLGM